MPKPDYLLPTGGTAEARYPSSTPTPTINTPSTSTSPRSGPPSRRTSPCPPVVASKARVSPPLRSQTSTPVHATQDLPSPKEFAGDWDLDDEEEMDRPPLSRPTDGRSHTPLLKEERGRTSYDAGNGSARPAFAARRSTFRSRSPDMQDSSAVRKKYTYAGFFLLLSLVSFVIQTETAVYIQHELGWKKAYCML